MQTIHPKVFFFMENKISAEEKRQTSHVKTVNLQPFQGVTRG